METEKDQPLSRIREAYRRVRLARANEAIAKEAHKAAKAAREEAEIALGQVVYEETEPNLFSPIRADPPQEAAPSGAEPPPAEQAQQPEAERITAGKPGIFKRVIGKGKRAEERWIVRWLDLAGHQHEQLLEARNQVDAQIEAYEVSGEKDLEVIEE